MSYPSEKAELSDLYCQECGCEIRTPDDVGVNETRIGGQIGFYPGGRPRVEESTVICHSCLDEHLRAHEEYTRSEEFELECMMEKIMWEDNKR